MLRLLRLMIMMAFGCSLLGCSMFQSGTQEENGYGTSEEWRLRTLEEKALQFSNADMETQERIIQLEARVDALEGGEGSVQPLMSSDKLPEAGAKPSQKSADWDKYEAPAKYSAGGTEAKATPKSAPKSKVAPAKAQGASAYDQALKNVLAGKSQAGRAGLTSFLSKYPKSSLVPNAQYWIGESYYHQKKFAEAIVAFKKVHQQYPRHDKAAAALLKIGYSYAQLGDTNNARFYLDVLTQDYPKSDPAKLGRQRLKTLK